MRYENCMVSISYYGWLIYLLNSSLGYTIFIPYSDQTCLRSPLGVDYMGNIYITAGDLVCIPWSEASYTVLGRGQPFSFLDGNISDAANFCRNPNTDPGGPWCYYNQTGWDYCSIPRCGKWTRFVNTFPLYNVYRLFIMFKVALKSRLSYVSVSYI